MRDDYPQAVSPNMADFSVRIERATNGYEICARDPKIVKYNDKPYDSKNPRPYKDPNREYVFQTLDEVLAWLKANLDTALPADEYDSAFDEAAAEDD